MLSTFTLLFIQYTHKIKKGSIVLNKKLTKTSLILTTTKKCAHVKTNQKKNRLEDCIHPQESIASSDNESEKTNLFPAVASYVGPGISDGRRGNKASKLRT